LKRVVFQERLADGRAASLTRAQFDDLLPLMATVRRRVAPLIAEPAWHATRDAIATLLEGAHDTTTADARVAAFESALRVAHRGAGGRPAGEREGEQPSHRVSERCLRDFASELLHNTLPEHYPLMHRWIWDSRANSGVIRQVWHDPNGAGDDVDHVVIDLGDGYETHLMLREELSQFLADNGVYRDMLWHVDLVCAQIYGDYISAQGGAYLKADFVSDGDPLEHTRRILGLDRVAAKGARSARAIDGASRAPLPSPAE
jgi:hypothetical protein